MVKAIISYEKQILFIDNSSIYSMLKKCTILKIFTFRLLFFVIIINNHLFSQTRSSTWYNMDNGLPQNSIKDIIKDKYGFIWLSTENGIVKYDGSKFDVYNDFPTKTLNFEYFRGDIEKDKIIISCGNDNLQVAIHEREAKISTDKNFPASVVYFQNLRYAILNKNIFFIGAPSYFKQYALYFNHSKYYFNSENTVLFENGKYKELAMPKSFNSLKDLSNIFAFNEKLFILNKEEKKITTIFHDQFSQAENISPIIFQKDAKIYWQQSTNQTFVIFDNKIYRVSYKNNTIDTKYVIEYESFDTDQIHSIFYDEKFNKLYLGSLTKGLKVLTLDRFYNSQDHSKFVDNVYYSTLPYGQNSVITEVGNVYDKYGIIEQKKFEKTSYKRFLSFDNHFNIIYPKHPSIIRRLKSTNYKTYDSIPSPNNLSLLTLNSVGNKIAAIYQKLPPDQLLYIYDENGKKEVELKIETEQNLNFIEKFDPGFLLLGNSQNLLWYSISKKTITFSLKFNIGLKQIQKLSKDTYLLTTFKNGPYILKNKKLIKLPLDPQKNMATAHIALEDKAGNFWITSNNGLFKIRKQNILDFIEKKRNNLFYYTYTKEDGLVNNEFNGTSYPCANTLENGEFVFPSMEGLVFFKPEEIMSHYPKSEDLYLERFRSENKIAAFNNKLYLPSDYKTAELLVDIPYYGNLENINLEYKIDDDNGWKKISNKAINLAGLSYGLHDINVRMLISEKGNFSYKKITVEVEPKFYQTLWFRILIVTALLLLILSIVHFRTKRLQSKNQILKKTVIKKAKELDESLKNLQENQEQLSNQSEYEKKVIENIIHDITTPVRFIALISQQLTDTIDPEAQKEYFESLYASSEQLHKYTLNLKDYTQIYKEDKNYEDEYYSLAEIVNEKKLLFHEIALHNNTIISNDVHAEININIKKSFMNMILHNLIDNAVKNTFDGYITISGYFNSEKNIILEIKDTGNGMQDHDIEYYNNMFSINGKMSDPKYKSSLGLYLISQVSKKIDISVSFSKNLPKGTFVKLVIKNTHTNEQENYNS
ncbi:HAMP domain-containing sensor histidine kinase [Chryseobacterium sp.]|uniref:sensor histidine kinase n=1 Tax=Chryseobacterium sp. TaxID=1871047 RepID=UPI00289C78DF|nr:HAMP domain-containing sensor histidine kinase [Chryseobacterium sp.]